jgi:hypothetical protein
MYKMASHCPFGHLQLKLWAKEEPGVKLPVWLPTTKVRNRPFPDVASRSATWRWKALNKSYNFGLELVPIRVRGEELWPSKIPRLQPGTISGLQLGSPGKKSHSDVVSEVRHKEYYMGEDGGFLRVQAVVSQIIQVARGLSQHPRVFPNAN